MKASLLESFLNAGVVNKLTMNRHESRLFNGLCHIDGIFDAKAHSHM